MEIKNGEGTLKEIREAEYRASEYYSEENEIQRELEDVKNRRCGKYLYFLEIKYFASHIGSSSRITIHQICRYDIETGEKVVMQIDDDYAEAEYERYIKDFTPIDWCVRDY